MFKLKDTVLRQLKKVFAAALVGLALFAGAAPVQANDSQSRIQEQTRTETGADQAQSMLTNTSSAQPRLSENTQLLILFGLLVALHGGASFILKQGKQNKA